MTITAPTNGTTTAESTERAAESTAAARQRGRGRRVLGWALIVVLLVGGALLALRVVATPPLYTGTLNPDGRNPVGARAVAEILRQQGVEVEVITSSAAVPAALRDGSTLAMADPYSLSDETVQAMTARADRVVLLTSSERMLRLLGLGVGAGFAPPPVGPECDVAEFAAVGTIQPTRTFEPADGVTACFPSDDGAAVLVDERGGRTVSIVEGSQLFSNERLAENGNAALALALLGQSEHVVWYVPSFEDGDMTADAADTLGTRTPEWVTPALLMLLLAGIAAAVWRGRRFGPLVAETLPVTVRASETMHGRARLTAKAADAGHAAGSVRAGTVRRLARRLGLSERAAPHEVADAASDRLRIPRGSLHDLLAGPLPSDDQQLVDSARRLAELEDAVAAAVHIERNTP